MPAPSSLSLERLREALNYDPLTGIFIRTQAGTPGNQRFIGEVAGNLDAKGYRVISIDGKTYKAHRLAWFYVTGEWPKNQIDHQNEDKDDNRFRNLRDASGSQNQQNRGKPRTNTSGQKGVYWLTRKRPWRASIRHKGRQIYLGSFFTKDEATAAYAAAAKNYHREFAKVFDL